MEKMSKSKFVEYVMNKVLEQGGPSVRWYKLSGETLPEVKRIYCAYRGNRGRKCLIGWAIEDDKYSKEFERTGVDVFFQDETKEVLPEWVLDFGGDFLVDLQGCHDRTIEVRKRDWRNVFLENMRCFKTVHNLKVTIPDE